MFRLIKFEKEGYARIGVMSRYGDANSVKWFDLEPCMAFHVLNCFEDGNEVSNNIDSALSLYRSSHFQVP